MVSKQYACNFYIGCIAIVATTGQVGVQVRLLPEIAQPESNPRPFELRERS